MSAEAEGWRCERKFVLPAGTSAGAEVLVRRHPALFRQVHPPRWVNSLYLDTPDWSLFRASQWGAAARHKVRLRWYGPLWEADAATLEFKRKRGHWGRKETHRLAELPVAPGLSLEALQVRFRGLPAPARAELSPLQLALVVRYRRSYWLAAGGAFRMTIDERLCFRACAPGRVDVGRAHGVPDTILELKYPAEHDDEAEGISQHLPVRLRRSSKYVSGVEATTPRCWRAS